MKYMIIRRIIIVWTLKDARKCELQINFVYINYYYLDCGINCYQKYDFKCRGMNIVPFTFIFTDSELFLGYDSMHD